MNSFDVNALNKPKILITQQHTPSLDATYQRLREYFGAEIDFRAFTEARFLSTPQFRIHKPVVSNHTAFLFTNRVVIDGFFKLVNECSIFLPKTTKYFLATESLQSHLCKYVELRKRKIICGRHRLEDLLPIMHKHKKERFLLPCSKMGRKTISGFFKKKHYHYTELPIYDNVYCDIKDLNPKRYHMIVFYSPFAVEAFSKSFPTYEFGSTQVAAFSEKTIEAVKRQNWPIAVTAPTKNTPSMVGGLIDYFDGFHEGGKGEKQKQMNAAVA